MDAMMARRNVPTPYHCSGRRRTRENRIFSPRTVVSTPPCGLFCFAYRVTKRKGQFLPDNTDTLSSTQPGLSNIYYIVVLWTVVYLSADRLTPFGRSYPFQVPTQLICNDRERVEGGSTKPCYRRYRTVRTEKHVHPALTILTRRDGDIHRHPLENLGVWCNL